MARSTVVSRQHQDDDEYDFQDEQGEHWSGRLLIEILEVAVLTLLIFLLLRVFVQNYQVEGPSMQPTLHSPEYILVNKASYYIGSPQRGDIIVFEYPLDTSKNFVKRVIGVPGDTIVVDAQGDVVVDGVRLQEPYVKNHNNPYRAETVTLAANQYFVLGDNRGDSSDSRDWGTVPRSDIIGKAELVYWPFPAAHILQDWSSQFRSIHP